MARLSRVQELVTGIPSFSRSFPTRLTWPDLLTTESNFLLPLVQWSVKSCLQSTCHICCLRSFLDSLVRFSYFLTSLPFPSWGDVLHEPSSLFMMLLWFIFRLPEVLSFPSLCSVFTATLNWVWLCFLFIAKPDMVSYDYYITKAKSLGDLSSRSH